jgi:cytosine/adenosine deaminase-related metal-dependent hydrolase
LKLLKADFILTCNDDFEIIQNGAIAFENYIVEYGKSEDLEQKYPDATLIQTPENSVVMPGLINPHVHLEFSSNKSTLTYGDFITWLNSVILYRDELIPQSDETLIKNTLEEMKKSGTTTLGAISSFGNDLQACKQSRQRVIYFVELLGSRPDSVDILFADFKSKLRAVEELEDERFIPAVSIHSPYSTHPILAKNALDIARKYDYVVSTHFMESVAEREWLDSEQGDFTNFFSNFAPNAKPMSSADEYIELFQGTKALFTHCVQAKKRELEKIHSMGGFITHCPVSNRLLGVGQFDMKKLTCKDNFTIGTDGLSSNISLNLWDELRAFLLVHSHKELNSLAKTALLSVTKNAAKALRQNSGVIESNKYADFLVCNLPHKMKDIQDIALHLILHTHKPSQIYISGELV